MRQAAKFFLFALGIAGLSDCGRPPLPEKEKRLGSLEHALKAGELDAWYPRALDTTYGGYLSDFGHDWNPDGPQRKMIVTQARHVWSLSKAAARYPDAGYGEMAAHGARFLAETMWDPTHGGFYTLVSREGEVLADGANRLKTAYGNAFAVYGLAAYAGASGDSAALDLARRAFDWLETHSHDPEQGGYFQFLERDGTPLVDGFEDTPPKDQNSSIHLLEAFTELYRAWPDERVRRRLSEMHTLVRDTMTHERGYLQLFFSRDWQPLSYRDSSDAVREAHYALDHVSFGHDVETAFLLLDAAETLGVPSDSTLAVARRLVEHALRYGWDAEAGGFYDRGYYLPGDDRPTIVLDTKTWWAQAEALTTFALLAQHVPAERARFLDLFDTQWRYVQAHLLDPDHGGWYDFGLDRSPERKTAPKAHVWKGSYHTVRSLMQSIDRLQSLSEPPPE
jgi:mannobiose 2-epimerase